MKKTLFVSLLLMVMVMLFTTSCTENRRARTYGGEMTIDLAPNTKLVNVTWKESDLWILTTEMESEYTPKKYKFEEKSKFGVWEGTIYFIEHR